MKFANKFFNQFVIHPSQQINIQSPDLKEKVSRA